MDLHEKLQKELEEKQKQHPELSLQWVDTHPDVLRDRINVDGFQPLKETDPKKAGTNGEIRVGDLILAGRPRKEAEEERKRIQAKTRGQIESPVSQFEAELDRAGGGKYLKPMTPNELARDRSSYKGGRS